MYNDAVVGRIKGSIFHEGRLQLGNIHNINGARRRAFASREIES
jgi:hypothetical protein